ncbi:MAG: MBL fold metallo-hydrolase [Spirochaetes bacterium]|nr:MBL fold metallo-hydrolase [Spirochaetota bacterium]
MKRALVIIIVLRYLLVNLWGSDPGLTGSNTNYLIFIGHATVFIHLDGINIIADPNWNDRDVFLKRHTPPALPLTNLPPLDMVLISHGHYDHMDTGTIKDIVKLNPDINIFLPKNLGVFLKREKILNYSELNADQTITNKGIIIQTYQARHNGSRFIYTDTELALCFLIKGSRTIFFSGDTGYTNTFEKIGKKEKVDLACLEIQGWKIPRDQKRNYGCILNPFRWKDPQEIPDYSIRHLHPSQTIQAFIDLKARYLIPIHYNTFFVEFMRGRDNLAELRHIAEEKGIGDNVIIEPQGTRIPIP